MISPLKMPFWKSVFCQRIHQGNSAGGTLLPTKPHYLNYCSMVASSPISPCSWEVPCHLQVSQNTLGVMLSQVPPTDVQQREWGRSYPPSYQVGDEREGQMSPPWALPRTKLLLRNVSKKKKARGNLVVLL